MLRRLSTDGQQIENAIKSLRSKAAGELDRWRGRFAPTIRLPHRTVVHASTLTRSPAADPHPRYAHLVLK